MADADATAAAIADLLDDTLRLPAPATEDRFPAEGRPRLVARLAAQLRSGAPVRLVLPGFPFKNPNPRKTLGPLPDLAEAVALERLEAFARAAGGLAEPLVGAPGCVLTVVSDGRVWGDLLGIPRDTQRAWAAALRALGHDSPHLAFADLDDAMAADPGAAGDAVAWMERRWGPDPAALAALLAPDGPDDPASQDRRAVHRRFVGLLLEDRAWPGSLPTEARRRLAEADAQRMMLRHAAFSGMLADRFGEAVRLSVHRGTGAGPKVPVRLVPGGGPLPYHGVAVRDAHGAVRTTTRCDAEADPGLHLVRTTGGQPWCFERRT